MCPLTSHRDDHCIATRSADAGAVVGCCCGTGSGACPHLWEGKGLVAPPLVVSSGRKSLGDLWKC